MTICRFYLQGTCRFGNKCWNEHVDPSPSYHHRYDSPAQHHFDDDYYQKYSYRNPRYSPPLQSSFSFAPQRNRSDSHFNHQDKFSFSFNKAFEQVNRYSILEERPEKTIPKDKENDEIEFIKDDMTRWELGKQWPFSCYAPTKSCFPGFEDISPEELRWQYYDAKDSGTLNMHIQSISEYAERMKLRRNELKTASPQVIATLKSLQNDPKPTFGNISSTVNPFKFSDNKTSFGTEKTLLQKPASPGTFRFTLSDSSEQPKSPFRLHQFGTQDNQINIFGNSTQSTAMETSVFGSFNNESKSNFSHNIGNTPFVLSSSFVEQKNSNLTHSQSSTGLCNIDSNKLDAMSNNNELIYTEFKMLNSSEKEQYTSNSKHFALGKIPTKPPPREMCF